MSNNLFDEFDTVSAAQWKQKIQFDLKGADYNKTLLTHTREGITINPFYHKDTYKHLDVPQGPDAFKNCQSFYAGNERLAGRLAKDAVKRGAESIKFVADRPFDYNILFKGLLNKKIPFFFQLNFLKADFIKELKDFLKGNEVYFNIDLIGNLAKTGNWFFNDQKDHQILEELLKDTVETHGILGVDVSLYQNTGAHAVQQVAYALAHASEYLNYLNDLVEQGSLSKTDLGRSVKQMLFTFSVGNNYFFEIAKLRAFRYLWNLLLKEYQLSYSAKIYAQPSLRNKTLFDAHVNMLRTTSESMSAVFGGADFIGNLSYDAFFKKKNEFGERISRNQLIILKEESNLKNTDFTKGAYYIEELTYEIALRSLEIFKEIEKGGGFVKQLFKGVIQRKIRESADKEQKRFDAGDLVLLGSNKYPDPDERISKDDLELYPFVRKRFSKTLIEYLIPVRLSEKLEQSKLSQR
ncbi:MAG: methylmalonyl-CoA mutase [Flavobacteriia bacterium]|nr:MAG: methylmalonyl-CoA mutase [Flavobacteriia bacterium]